MSGPGLRGNAPVFVSVSGLLEGVGRTKPIRGKAVWGDGVRDGGLAGLGGWGRGAGGGAGGASAWVCFGEWGGGVRGRGGAASLGAGCWKRGRVLCASGVGGVYAARGERC